MAHTDRIAGRVFTFWKPAEKNGWCSNWYPSPFTGPDGTSFSCVEQWIMYKKALLFGDSRAASNILAAANDPRKQKAIGRRVRNFDEATWLGSRDAILYEGLLLKFQQNPELGRRLQQTTGQRLAEASPSDAIYGIGLAPEDPETQDPAAWRGTNLLGHGLERVRFELFSSEFELRSLVDRAEAAAKAKDPLAALTLLTEADSVAANMPNGETVHKERCRALALKVRVSGRLGDHEGALEAAEQLVALSSHSARALQLMGAALYGVKRVPEALATFHDALAALDGADVEQATVVEATHLRQLVQKGIDCCRARDVLDNKLDLQSCVGATEQIIKSRRNVQ